MDAFVAVADPTRRQIIESLSLKIFGKGLLPIGPALYRMGLTFSVGIMLFPMLIFTVMWIVMGIGVNI